MGELMINGLQFPDQFTTKLSDALAIFQKDAIVYANNSFEKWYNHLHDKDKRDFRSKLSGMHLDLHRSKSPFIHTEIILSQDLKKVDVDVYLLNRTASAERALLVLASPQQTVQTASSSISIQDRDTQLNQKKAAIKKLSPVFSELIGEDPHFIEVLLTAQKAAKSDYPVLIKGESGTGKEILARTIHQTSRRNQKKFVDINCAAIPDQLIDSELFGYEKGAFTGASPGGRHGLFVEANQGTLFFDEVADASLQTQAKLLRVLNEGYFKRVGGTKNIEVDVRIISATNKDLSQFIKDKQFREDLIYRLNTISIHLPPLRERPNDIPLLANHFLNQHAKQKNQILEFSVNCLDVLWSYHWPGNVRELKGVVDYAVTMATGSLITDNYLPDFLLPPEHRKDDKTQTETHQPKADQGLGLLSTAVQHAERKIIREVLQQAKNRSEAIKILGISRRTFYSKLKQYKLD
jgi:transcriptional regulator with PAS, ATPase and Fis domain